jgi:hypothetical protein
MGWTKRQLIEEAFAELALAGHTFDITAEELQTALRRLDTMMATWEANGIRVGYALPSSPDAADIDQPSGLPDAAVETVFLNLAIRLASGFGKQVRAETRKAASEGHDVLMRAAAMPIEQQLPSTLPRGAGNRALRGSERPFFPPPSDSPLGIAQGGDLDILAE